MPAHARAIDDVLTPEPLKGGTSAGGAGRRKSAYLTERISRLAVVEHAAAQRLAAMDAETPEQVVRRAALAGTAAARAQQRLLNEGVARGMAQQAQDRHEAAMRAAWVPDVLPRASEAMQARYAAHQRAFETPWLLAPNMLMVLEQLARTENALGRPDLSEDEYLGLMAWHEKLTRTWLNVQRETRNARKADYQRRLRLVHARLNRATLRHLRAEAEERFLLEREVQQGRLEREAQIVRRGAEQARQLMTPDASSLPWSDADVS